MAVLLEDIVKSVEFLLRLIQHKSQEQTYVDPTLDPVLLVPGIAGSILNAVDDKTGKKERVWVRILGADHEFQDKLWSRFDPQTGMTVNLSTDTHIEVPQDRYGLYAIDSLDPDMILGGDCVYYFHDMIVELLKWGYKEGTTLFGFGYDFRQSNRLKGTMERLASKLESVFAASGGRKINIISHSMGGLLVKCFMSLHADIFEKYVKNWIAIAAPFRGAPGYITSTLLNGASFVEGWEENFFISKWSMHQLLIECPSIYELMACLDYQWENVPLLEIWRQKCDSNGNSTVMLESYPPAEAVPIFMESFSVNKITYDGVDVSLPFNTEILKWANETRKLLCNAEFPGQIKFYNIYGTDNKTPHSVCYGSRDAHVTDLKQLPKLEVPFVGPPQTVSAGSEPSPYGFVAAGGLGQQQPPTQQIKPRYGSTQPGDGSLPLIHDVLIFRCVFHCKLVNWHLYAAWQLHQVLRRVDMKGIAISVSSLLCQNMLKFINSLLHYLTFEVGFGVYFLLHKCLRECLLLSPVLLKPTLAIPRNLVDFPPPLRIPSPPLTSYRFTSAASGLSPRPPLPPKIPSSARVRIGFSVSLIGLVGCGTFGNVQKQ